MTKGILAENTFALKKKANNNYHVSPRGFGRASSWQYKSSRVSTVEHALRGKNEHSSLIWFTGLKSKAVVLKSEFIKIEINEKQYFLHGALGNIAAQINDAKEILSYDNDWDGEGSLAANPVIFHNAINFIVSYSNFIFKHYSNTILSTPYIDISKDGGINILWDTSKAKFLIFFKNSNSKNAFFFAEKTDTKIPFKSAIEINSTIDESIASWMKVNLAI